MKIWIIVTQGDHVSAFPTRACQLELAVCEHGLKRGRLASFCLWSQADEISVSSH